MRTGIDKILEIIIFILTFILIVFYIISIYTYPEITNYKNGIELVDIFI